MSTPRKAWFRLADSLTKEPLTNDELATVVRLQGEMNTRWAREGLTATEAGIIVLRPGDLISVSGKKRLDSARRVLHSLAGKVSIVVEESGSNTTIRWPKWPEFQGLHAREQGNAGAIPARRLPPTPTPPRDAPAPSLQSEVATPDGEPLSLSGGPDETAWGTTPNGDPDPSPKRKAKKSRSTLAPEVFTPEQAARLAKWNAKRKLPLTADELAEGWATVYEASHKNEKIKNIDWVLAFQGYLRKGWPLDGYVAPAGTLSPQTKSFTEQLMKIEAEEAAKRGGA